MIQVKFFSSFRELVGMTDTTIAHNEPLSLRDIWSKSTPEALPSNTLCAINMNYAKLDDLVQDDDEVAFFPPVTGG